MLIRPDTLMSNTTLSNTALSCPISTVSRPIANYLYMTVWIARCHAGEKDWWCLRKGWVTLWTLLYQQSIFTPNHNHYINWQTLVSLVNESVNWLTSQSDRIFHMPVRFFVEKYQSTAVIIYVYWLSWQKKRTFIQTQSYQHPLWRSPGGELDQPEADDHILLQQLYRKIAQILRPEITVLQEWKRIFLEFRINSVPLTSYVNLI